MGSVQLIKAVTVPLDGVRFNEKLAEIRNTLRLEAEFSAFSLL